MNILHVYKDYYPVLGGIENHLKVLAEAQVAAGHQVTVLVCNRDFHTFTELLNNVEVIKAGRLTTLASMPLSLSQPAILARQRPDIIHIHSPYPLGEVANWLFGRAKHTVITYHSDVVRQQTILRFYAPFLRRVLLAADKIIATSPRYIASSPWLQAVSEKCRVVPLGVDTSRFTPARPKPTEKFSILFVGQLRYYKGVDTLLTALASVPNAHLTLVGQGPMQTTWQTLARELGLDNRVTFAGAIADADLPRCYQQADLFVLPANARSEAFGTVLLEAMASGLPCISTELGTGTSWVVQHEVTGLVVPPQDPLALAEAIKIIQTDNGLRLQMGQAGLKRVRDGFSQKKMIQQVMEIYQQLLER